MSTRQQTDTIHVDPVTGDDSLTGFTWADAKRTIQAAVDAAPRGGEVVLAPGEHIVGPGVVADSRVPLTISGARPLAARQHADRRAGQAHITSGATGDTRPTSLIRVGEPDSSHVYGWTFRNLYFDGDSITPGGACIETHGVNKAVLEDVGTRALKTGEALRYLVRSGPGSGNDASWWNFRNVWTAGVGLATSRMGNYWTFDNTTVHSTVPTLLPGPALSLEGSQHNLDGLNLEGWDTGVLATGCRGVLGHGVMSESVRVLVHLVRCRDSIISVNSAAGYGHSEVVDENGDNNTVTGTYHRKIGSTTNTMTVSPRGVTWAQTAAGSANLIHSPHPTLPDVGVDLPPSGVVDVFGSGVIRVDYWDGAAWVLWDVATGVLSASNGQSIVVDSTHRRVRFRTPNMARAVKGLGMVGTRQKVGGDTRYTFRVLNWSGKTVHAEHSVVTDSPGQTKGAHASFGVEGAMFEVEIDFGLTGAQTAEVTGLRLYTPDPDPAWGGKQSRGAVAPEGVIHGAPADTYLCTVEDIGLWVHTGPAGLAGWRKLAYAP